MHSNYPTEAQCERLRHRWQKGPRLNNLRPHFEAIAKGEKQVPLKAVKVDENWLAEHPDIRPFSLMLEHNLETFYQHYCASIPFTIEDHCRTGYALAQFVEAGKFSTTSPFCYYESNSADAPLSRTLAEYCEGKVQTLTDTPNAANVDNFHRACRHPWSQIYHGPFFDITPERLQNTPSYRVFDDGFDTVYFNMTFQFYEAQRDDLVDYTRRILKPQGLFLLSEKLKIRDVDEYLRRERIKDSEFKSQYFNEDALTWKSDKMLRTMSEGQADFDDLVACLKSRFTHVYLTWNDGNFYTFACADDHTLISRFLANLVEPCLPGKFRFYEQLPMQL